MNELIFLFHILVVIAFLFTALRLGQSALTGFAAIQGILANLFVLKQVHLFGLSVTCTDVFAISGILSLNLLQEYFGKDGAKQAIRLSFLSLLFFFAMSQLHLLYHPTPSDTTQAAFSTLLSSTPRILLASISTFYFVQQFDLYLFSLLRGRLPLRIAFSLITSQLLDTTLFTLLGLYGLVESVFDIILVSFFIKCIIIAISSPFVAFSKRFVKHAISV